MVNFFLTSVLLSSLEFDSDLCQHSLTLLLANQSAARNVDLGHVCQNLI